MERRKFVDGGIYRVPYNGGFLRILHITRRVRTAFCKVSVNGGPPMRAEILHRNFIETLTYSDKEGWCYIVSACDLERERK